MALNFPNSPANGQQHFDAATGNTYTYSSSTNSWTGNVIGQTIPIGSSMWWWAEGSVPAGWIALDGQELNRTTYSALFAVFGTQHGAGDGSTTFNVPDTRGRFIRGVDDGSGRDEDVDDRTLVGTGAAGEAGSTQADQFKSHNHKVDIRTDTNANVDGPNGTNDGKIVSKATTDVGGSETRPKNIYAYQIMFAGI